MLIHQDVVAPQTLPQRIALTIRTCPPLSKMWLCWWCVVEGTEGTEVGCGAQLPRSSKAPVPRVSDVTSQCLGNEDDADDKGFGKTTIIALVSFAFIATCRPYPSRPITTYIKISQSKLLTEEHKRKLRHTASPLSIICTAIFNGPRTRIAPEDLQSTTLPIP